MSWWNKNEPVVRDDEYGEMSLSEYRSLVGSSMDEHEQNMEDAASGGDARFFSEERDAFAADRDRWAFANCVEENPETPVRWNRW